MRFCQFDGLILSETQVTLVEVKLSHTVDAFWQIENLYLPVLRVLFRPQSASIATCEIVKWYDPSVAYPRKPFLLEDVAKARPGAFNVHILTR